MQTFTRGSASGLPPTRRPTSTVTSAVRTAARRFRYAVTRLCFKVGQHQDGKWLKAYYTTSLGLLNWRTQRFLFSLYCKLSYYIDITYRVLLVYCMGDRGTKERGLQGTSRETIFYLARGDLKKYIHTYLYYRRILYNVYLRMSQQCFGRRYFLVQPITHYCDIRTRYEPFRTCSNVAASLKNGIFFSRRLRFIGYQDVL